MTNLSEEQLKIAVLDVIEAYSIFPNTQSEITGHRGFDFLSRFEPGCFDFSAEKYVDASNSRRADIVLDCVFNDSYYYAVIIELKKDLVDVNTFGQALDYKKALYDTMMNADNGISNVEIDLVLIGATFSNNPRDPHDIYLDHCKVYDYELTGAAGLFIERKRRKKHISLIPKILIEQNNAV